MGHLLNAKHSIILYDKLGKDFELSRNTKQSIFNKRRDLSEVEKSEIYMKMKENREKQLKDLLIHDQQ